MSDPRPEISLYKIDEAKLGGYLLSLHHTQGASKAALFLAHNFDVESLGTTLLRHALSAEWHSTRVRPFGYLFEVRGGVLTPINRGLDLRAVWAVDNDDPTTARFVTAYPT